MACQVYRIKAAAKTQMHVSFFPFSFLAITLSLNVIVYQYTMINAFTNF